YHTLMLTAGGKALATGYNSYGELGDGTFIMRSQLLAVKNATLIGSIAAGSFSSTLLRPFTKSLATGLNQHGQLGVGGTAPPAQVTTLRRMQIGSNILAVSTGPSGHHSLLLRADGTVWACGYNAYGQLGQGTTTDSYAPVQVKGPNGVGFLTNIIAIAAGNFHSLALAADGTIYSWGRNSHGQLGTGDTTDRFYPVHVPGVTNAYAIAAGGYQSLALV